jgi:hypothetical protein
MYTNSIEGDMLGEGVLLTISDIGPGVQCTYTVQGDMLGGGSVTVYSRNTMSTIPFLFVVC